MERWYLKGREKWVRSNREGEVNCIGGRDGIKGEEEEGLKREIGMCSEGERDGIKGEREAGLKEGDMAKWEKELGLKGKRETETYFSSVLFV